jgi:hypothetical protein
MNIPNHNDNLDISSFVVSGMIGIFGSRFTAAPPPPDAHANCGDSTSSRLVEMPTKKKEVNIGLPAL